MISHRNLFLTVMLAVSQTMCIWGKRLPVVAPEKVGLSSTLLQRADSAILQAIAEKEIPGAVLCVVRHDRIGYLKAYGNKQVWPEKLPMETGTVFDMASCSKSMSTAISVLILAQEGKIRLLDPVRMYVPGFQNWKDEDGETTTIRIQHLLTRHFGEDQLCAVGKRLQDIVHCDAALAYIRPYTVAVCKGYIRFFKMVQVGICTQISKIRLRILNFSHRQIP